jgi:hypothetical protein
MFKIELRIEQADGVDSKCFVSILSWFSFFLYIIYIPKQGIL